MCPTKRVFWTTPHLTNAVVQTSVWLVLASTIPSHVRDAGKTHPSGTVSAPIAASGFQDDSCRAHSVRLHAMRLMLRDASNGILAFMDSCVHVTRLQVFAYFQGKDSLNNRLISAELLGRDLNDSHRPAVYHAEPRKRRIGLPVAESISGVYNNSPSSASGSPKEDGRRF